jgi:diguanylate cyclase (GGDEF)-like protein
LGDFSVDTRLLAGTNVLQVAVTGTDPALTQKFAEAIGQEMISYLQNLYEIYDLKPLDQPYLPRSPISPNKTLNLILGTALGLVLGISLAFLTEYLQAPPIKGTSFDILDENTGVYNKYYFLHRLSEEMVRAKRNRYNLSLALIRVNNVKLLKGINAGRVRVEILRQVALVASQHLREEDIVAYLGDDVFGVLLPDITGENAKSIMEYLQTRVAWTPFESTVDDSKLNIKTTVGVVTYTLNGTSRDDLVAKANQALQMAEIDEDGKAYLLSDVSEE